MADKPLREGERPNFRVNPCPTGVHWVGFYWNVGWINCSRCQTTENHGEMPPIFDFLDDFDAFLARHTNCVDQKVSS